jgi:hypothetical protein
MILAIVLATGTALSPASKMDELAWCTSVRRMAVATATAKLNGLTETQAHGMVFTIENPYARASAHAVIYMAYHGNADDGVSPKVFGSIAFQACMSEE